MPYLGGLHELVQMSALNEGWSLPTLFSPNWEVLLLPDITVIQTDCYQPTSQVVNERCAAI